MKTCANCKVEKPLEQMGKNKSSKDGYNIYCKECIKEKSKAQRDADIEKNRAYQNAWAAMHREQIKAKNKRLYQRKGDEIREYNRRYRQENYEHRLEIERTSRAKNKERWRPGKNARQSARYRVLKENQFVILDKELQRIYASPCYNCGSMENQTLDHIIPLSKGGRHSIGNIGTLCSSCNASKHARTITEWKHSKRMLGVG